MELTGFNSFWVYNSVKYVHFTSKRVNVLDKLPKKEMYLKKWNEEMIHRRESLMFMKLDEKFKNHQDRLIRLFAYYYLQDARFYVTDVFNDNFNLFDKMEYELNHIKDVIENDFIKVMIYSLTNKVSMNTIFKSLNQLPDVFKLFDRGTISVHSLIAFNLSFGCMDRLKQNELNIVEQEKIKKYKKLLERYLLLVYKYFDFDIKEFLKTIYNKIKGEINNGQEMGKNS